jgi:hypothetical protein
VKRIGILVLMYVVGGISGVVYHSTTTGAVDRARIAREVYYCADRRIAPDGYRTTRQDQIVRAAIFLPRSMVERSVLGSNLLGFLAAATGVIIGPFSSVPNAQKETFPMMEGRINAQERREQYEGFRP